MRVIVKKSRKVPFDQEPAEAPKHDRKLSIAAKASDLITVAEKIAGDKFCYLKWYYPEGKKLFPLDHRLHIVSKYYPYAQGGPLFVDEPRTEYEASNCEQKRKFMKGMGLRYIIVQHTTTENDALEQLGEL